MPRGQAPDRLRKIKRNHIFNIIANNKDLSKIDIKRLSGYSMTSVISVIDELKDNNLVSVVESGVSSGGRPPQMINANPDGGHIIGVDLSRDYIACAIYNLKRDLIHSIYERTPDIGDIYQFLDRLIAIVERVKSEVKPMVKDFNLLGVGIGLPGYVDEVKGTVSRYKHIKDYQDVPIRKILSERFSVPVFLENNVNAIALGYKWLRREGKVKSLMVIAVRRGVKAGLIINNQLIKGANDYAGEIGTLKANPKGHITSQSGDTYEEILSDYTVVNKYKGIDKAVEIIDKAEMGDKDAISYLNELADTMAELIGYGQALISPEVIILVGGYTGSEYFVKLIKERIKGNITGGGAEELGTIGAAGLVVEKLFSY